MGVLRSGWLVAAVAVALGGCRTVPRAEAPAREVWVNLIYGDEETDGEVMSELERAAVIYLGEVHTIARHQAIQLELLQRLHARGVPLVLCLEQLEAPDQPAVDRYARKETGAEELVREIDWPAKWRNYRSYLALCEYARAHGIPIRALNAPAGAVRAVYRGGGVAKLAPELRAQLPAELQLDDPPYEALLALQLGVHASLQPENRRAMFEAQVVRDETMAANIVAARRSGNGPPRTAFVVLGAGHMRYGMGVPERVRRREPGLLDRLVLASEGGDLELTAEEKAAARDVTITHSDLRRSGRPPADYLRLRVGAKR